MMVMMTIAADHPETITMRSPTLWVVLLLSVGVPTHAQAYVMRDYPLREVIADMGLIFVATVQKVDPDKPGVILTVTEVLKGKPTFERMAINLTGDEFAKRDKHLPIMLERLAPDLPVLVFANKRGKTISTFAFTNGTWMNLSGFAEADGTVRWAFNHGEPYLQRTFKGTTAELKQIVIDGLAGKKDPPATNPKEEPGFGPPIGKEPKKGAYRTPAGTAMFGVIPTFVVVGPLAFLAALFPAVFGGLAILMRRWMVLLSIGSTCSTIYFLHGWFGDSLAGSFWGTPAAMWLLNALLCGIGTIWAARRFATARAAGQDDVMRSRKFDTISTTTLGAMIGLALLLLRGKNEPIMAFPWQELIAVAGGMWLCAGFLLVRRVNPGGISPEMVFLGGLTLSMGMIGAYEVGRIGNTGGEGIKIEQPSDNGSPTPSSVSVMWEYQAPGKGVMFASPASDGQRVFTAVAHSQGFADYGAVYAIDLTTGKEVWKFDNDEELKPVFSSPIVADGIVYIGEGFHKDQECKLFAIEASSGKKLWEFTTRSHTESRPAVADGKVVFGAGNDGVYCLDAKTGKPLWQYTGMNGVHVDANPVIANGKVFAGSGLSRTHQATRIFCIDLATGKEVWSERVEYSAFAAPVVDGDRVYFGIGNGNFSEDKEPIAGALLCRAVSDGKPIWQATAPNSILTQPTFDANHVYFGCRDHKVYAVDRATGEPKWNFALTAPILASPVIGYRADGKTPALLYVADEAGRIAALDVRNGQSRWGFDVLSHSQMTNVQMTSTPLVITSREGNKEQRRILFGTGLKSGLSAPARLFCLLEETIIPE